MICCNVEQKTVSESELAIDKAVDSDIGECV